MLISTIVTFVLLALPRLLNSIYADAEDHSINAPKERSGTRPIGSAIQVEKWSQDAFNSVMTL